MRWLVPIEVTVIVEADSKEEAYKKTLIRSHINYEDVYANLCNVQRAGIKKTKREGRINESLAGRNQAR